MKSNDHRKDFSPESDTHDKYFSVLLLSILLAGLVIISSRNYTLFHSIAEIFSIIIAFGIFVIAWNSRRVLDNNYLLFIGIAYLFVGGIDLVHTFAYKGMGIFTAYDANDPTQLWIAARSMESVSLLIAPYFIGRRLSHRTTFVVYAAVTSFLLWSILFSHVFPDCYREGQGLTRFKIIAEYVICCVLLLSGAYIFKKRSVFDRKVLYLILFSIAATVISELAFTFYIGVYDLSNMVGHLFKIISFYFIYLAIIKTGLRDPFDIIFRSLRQSQEELRAAKEELEQRVEERTRDLLLSNELLRQEIAERKKAEEELRESEVKFKSLADSAQDAIVMIDDENRVCYWNNAAEKMFGFPQQEMMGRDMHAVLAPHRYLEAYKQGFEGFKHTGQGHVLGRVLEMTACRRTGAEFPIELSVSALQLGGAWHALSIIRDITERRKLEAQLLQSQKMEAIGRLAGGVAHDFNNILSAIMGYGHLLLMKMHEGDALKTTVENVLEAVDRAAHLTKSLLAFSRKQVINPVPVDVNEIIRKMQKFLLRIIGEDIEMKTEFSQGFAIVKADAGQLEQVLMNLATNARDAMPHGGRLTIKTEEMEIDEAFIRAHGYGKKGAFMLLTITDTGIGMDEMTQKRIFEPFFTTKEPGKGTGLGLSIVYGIIEQHAGYISVHSEPGKGTSFRIYLPLAEAGTGTSVGDDGSRTTNLPRGTETILLAEDDDAVRRLNRTILEEFGYKVVEAVNGEEAVNIFLANQELIQLLLLDVIMPKKSGIEAYKEIEKARPGVKTIFVSGYTAEKIDAEGILKQGAELLMKPAAPGVILKKVREILDK